MRSVLLVSLVLSLVACTYSSKQQRIASGKQISFQRDRGNCLACHVIEDGEDPGNIGPALDDMQARFATKSQLKALIWDATQFNANTSMPPYGKNKILSADELQRVVDYIWSLSGAPNQPEKQ